MKRLILFFFLGVNFYSFSSKGYNITPIELTEKIITINQLIFDNDLEHYNKLIIGTISAETLYGKYRGNSPLGIAQISPDGWRFIKSRITEEDIAILKIVGYENIEFKDLANDPVLSLFFCSLYYKYKLNGNVPKNIEEYAITWKKYYNTSAGAGTVEDFKTKYFKHGEKHLKNFKISIE